MNNWEAIKRDYLCSDINLAELSRKHGLSYSTVKKRAAKGGWKAERDAAREKAEQQLQEVRDFVEDAKEKERKEIYDTIYNSAKRLIGVIDDTLVLPLKSSTVLNYAKALRELTIVIREVKDYQTITERQTYDLARKRLDIEKQKILGLTDDDGEKGVVLLPKVKDDE